MRILTVFAIMCKKETGDLVVGRKKVLDPKFKAVDSFTCMTELNAS